ncbi:MAG: VCBS repeat-containing protein [Pirellulales bacterium]|nr:VCBS repeat-containing protein [Pirellulales bacterium]
MKKLYIVLIPVMCMTMVSHSNGEIVSGTPLKVGTDDGRGPLAMPVIQSFPVGTAYISSSAGADLFVRGRGGSGGLYLYRWKAMDPSGTPVFSVPVPVSGLFMDSGSIFQTLDRVVHGVWLTKSVLVHTVFDADNLKFTEKERVSLEDLDLPDPSNVTVLLNPDGSVEVILEVSGGIKGVRRHYPGRNWSEDYDPFDGAGIWRGNLSYCCLYAISLPGLLQGPVKNSRLVSKTKFEVLFTMQQLTVVNLGRERGRDLVTGSLFGDFHYYHNSASVGIRFEQKQYVVDRSETVIRHPSIWPSVVAWPNPNSGLSDLIAGGEGAVYYYKFSGQFTSDGKPVYADPVAVLVEKADLYGGSLPVVNVVDWNGDGILDIVTGQSEGRILYFQNIGTDALPRFLNGIPLEAGGYPIFIQPGYAGDIQGPGEARWGYVCPTVVDWDQDGDLDIVMSDSTARHTVYINSGTSRTPKLEQGHPIYCDGLDMHGMWRVRPAAGKLGNRMAYIQVDADDKFHLYWRIDNYNLEDGGQLRLDNGELIGCSNRYAGGTGRCKIHLADWDQDGVKDLIVATAKWNSIPNRESGYPTPMLTDAKAMILFMKNVGTEEKPVFRHPVPFKHKGKVLYPGGKHSCSASVSALGGGKGPNLIIGNEVGQLMIFKREDLTW